MTKMPDERYQELVDWVFDHEDLAPALQSLLLKAPFMDRFPVTKLIKEGKLEGWSRTETGIFMGSPGENNIKVVLDFMFYRSSDLVIDGASVRSASTPLVLSASQWVAVYLAILAWWEVHRPQ